MTALQGATTLVTGGAGTIGSTIVDQLLAADVSRIRILDNLVRGRRANLHRHCAIRGSSWSSATSGTSISCMT